MIENTLLIALAMLALAMALNLYRLLRGPGLPDRILALDTLYINTIALLILLGLYQSTRLHFEAALVIAMLGFIGTVTLSRFIMRRKLIE